MDKKKIVIPMAVLCMSSVMLGTMTGCTVWDSIRDSINGKIDEVVTPKPDTKHTVTLKAGETTTVETKTGNVEIISGAQNDVKVTFDTDDMSTTIELPSGGSVTIGGKDFTNDRTTDMDIVIDEGGTITVLPETPSGGNEGGEEGGDSGGEIGGDQGGEGGDQGGEEQPPLVKITNLVNGDVVSLEGQMHQSTIHTYSAGSGFTIRSITLDKSLLSGDGTVISSISVSGNSIELNVPDTGNHSLDGTLKVVVLLSDGTTVEDEITLAINLFCLTGDSLILMADGSERRIDSLPVGEKVLSFNPETMQLEADEITYSDSKENKTHTEYDVWTFSDGTFVKTVHRHRLYNVDRQAMVNMDEWKIGEHAYALDGSIVALMAHENVKKTVKHYTLFTKNQNYFVNGLLSGNKHTRTLLI